MEKYLRIDGSIKAKGGREFTRLIGGFGEDKPMITTRQVSELMYLEMRVVNQTIARNIDSFEENLDIIDLKKVTVQSYSVLNTLKSLGYSNQAISNSKNIYALSQSGLQKYLQIAEPKKDYSDFIADYFGDIAMEFSMVRHEHCFANILSTTFSDMLTFIPQYHCCERYFVDFYEPTLNLVVEYDEEHHKYNKKEDIIREFEIKKELGCELIRVQKGKELEGVNEILKLISKKTEGEDIVKNTIVNKTRSIEVDDITFIEYIEDKEVVMILSGNGNFNYLGFETISDFGELSIDNCTKWISDNMIRG